MSLSLLVLGVLLALAGAGMLAYGIPINEFGLGNTLIVAGTTALVGGLILFALSDAVKQLRRIADDLAARPAGRGRNELFERTDEPPAARIPFPPKPEPRVRAPAPAAAEPRLEVAPPIATAAEEPEPVRAFAPTPEIIPDREDAPLSPQQRGLNTASERDRNDELSQDLLATAFARLDVSLRPAPPAEEPVKQDGMFESVWPGEPRQTAEIPEGAPEAQPPEPSPAAEQAAAEEQPEEPYAVSILKSGVVDGMAYTLYSDGSIEAEMPQGTMRFASIHELRAYLEKSS